MEREVSELKIGDIAPAFEANSTAGKLSLELFKDKNIVLYFYPKDMTPGCIIQAQGFTKLHAEFEKLDTKIIGISIDSLSSHDKFCDQESIQYPLLSDIDEKVCNLYGVIKERPTVNGSFRGITRATFLIGKNKKIFKIWRNVKPLDHAKKVLDATKIINLIQI
jgi:peroxiredoxin Q/BCP